MKCNISNKNLIKMKKVKTNNEKIVDHVLLF